MATQSENDWERLGQWVKSHRVAAGYESMKLWADAVGRSTRQLLGLERGEPVGDTTLVKIEHLLDWPPGTAKGVLRGGIPIRAVQEKPQHELRLDDDQVEVRLRRLDGRPLSAGDIVRALARVTAGLEEVLGAEQARSSVELLKGQWRDYAPAARDGVPLSDVQAAMQPDPNVDPEGPEHGA